MESHTFSDGIEFVAYAFKAVEIDGKPPRLILGFELGMLDVKSGFVTPDEARAVAALLIERAEWAEREECQEGAGA